MAIHGKALNSVSSEKKLKTSLTACKVMITLFWDCEEMVRMDSMPRGETVNSEAYIRTQTGILSVSDDFGLARTQPKSCFSKTAHKF